MLRAVTKYVNQVVTRAFAAPTIKRQMGTRIVVDNPQNMSDAKVIRVLSENNTNLEHQALLNIKDQLSGQGIYSSVSRTGGLLIERASIPAVEAARWQAELNTTQLVSKCNPTTVEITALNSDFLKETQKLLAGQGIQSLLGSTTINPSLYVFGGKGKKDLASEVVEQMKIAKLSFSKR